MDAVTLCARLRHELADVERRIRENRWLSELEAGRLPMTALRAFAAEQLLVIQSDERSFAGLAQRFDAAPVHGYFRGMAESERAALAALRAFAASVGATDEDYEPVPGCQAYPSYVARLARDGAPAEVAGAFLVNLEAWGGCCARMYAALRERYRLAESDLAFFAHFAGPTDELERVSLEVIDAGLAAGVPAAGVARAARLLQAYELEFWLNLPLWLGN